MTALGDSTVTSLSRRKISKILVILSSFFGQMGLPLLIYETEMKEWPEMGMTNRSEDIIFLFFAAT